MTYPYSPAGVPRFADIDPFPDPWIAVTAMAAATREIGFYTNVYVLPARNPVQVAKIMATASVFTGGRAALGVGMGWMPEEFAISGPAFHIRGRRAAELVAIGKR